ncbi:MAG: flagellar M-ring protein FliF [Treponema sp.]|jgi:flagellar M-ring protein FliF|nr:flagellar M-ring protein FliF [Treponema sp.]
MGGNVPEWLKKFFDNIKTQWRKWSLVQKLILAGIIVMVIAGIVALFSISASPTMVPVIDAPIRDVDTQDRIITRINAEGVRTSVSSAGIIMVPDEQTARRIRSLLIREDLIPSGTDPWAIFDRDRWTITDFERNVNLQRAITQMVTDHIKALDDVDDANVTLVMPERTLFESDQNPVSASVTIFPKPGSDITQNRKKIEGIQKLLKTAVAGLQDENITISDQSGNILNDFAGMAEMDRISLVERGQKMIRALEAEYRARVLSSLQSIFSSARVRDLNIKIDMDLSKRAVSTREYIPYVVQPRTPGLSYDDSKIQESVTRSKTTSETTWIGTGFNPEGPSGMEGQTPPAYRDMSNLNGEVTQKTLVQNEEIGERTTQEEKTPNIDRITISANIDGVWKIKRDEKGTPVITNGSIEREYTPVSDEQLRSATALIQNAVGYDAARGDSVSVQSIQIDRSVQFAEEDMAYFKQRQMRLVFILLLAGLLLLLLSFFIFRIISREIERRRRADEDARARREQELRENALMQAEEDEVQVTMSVEERNRLDLQESIANTAREHPEDVASLIRTWLLEE